MKVKKDVIDVQERIKAISNILTLTPLQVLLMKGDKWSEAKKLQKNKGSFYSAFQKEEVEIPVIVLFWDEIAPIIGDERVKQYLEKQISRKKIKD